MGIAAILGLVAQLVPTATAMVETLTMAGVKTGSSSDVLNLIGALTPVVADLVEKIETIRNQTEAEYPAVWDGIRTGWMVTLEKWQALQVETRD